MRRLPGLIGLGVAFLLIGCTTSDLPKPTDLVQSSAAAIDLAMKKDCLRPPGGEFVGQWSATLHDGVWDVTLRESDSGSRCAATYRDRIAAATGQSLGCSICVSYD